MAEENENQTKPRTRVNPFTNEEEEAAPLLIAPSPTDQRILASSPHTDPLPVLVERAVNGRGVSPGVDLHEHVGPSLQEDPLPGETPLPYAPVRETPVTDISVQNHPDYVSPDQGEEPPNDKYIEDSDVETLIGIEAGDENYPGQDTSEYAEQWTARKEAEKKLGTAAQDLPPIEAPYVGNADVSSVAGEDDNDTDTSAEPTKAELLEEARELDIEGRSSMNKDELADAVEEAKNEEQ